jgi:D-sedoheptulose 7-phosphate isomerase
MQIEEIIADSIATKQRLLYQPGMVEQIHAVGRRMADAFRQGGRVYFCGNGGSAADAQHLSAELSGAFYNRRRPALPAEALHVNTSYLTAVSNDYGYERVYERLVEGTMQEPDLLVGMSTSGNSLNIVLAFEAARKKKVTTVGMTGESGGKMKALSDYLLPVPSALTPRIQECHMLIGHILCQLVEEILFPPDSNHFQTVSDAERR